VPLDGSPLAEQALPHAEALARLMGVPLHLVRVIDPTRLGTPAGTLLHTDALVLELQFEDERIAAGDYLERIEQELRDRRLRVTVEYQRGPAAQKLLAVTRPGGLLVMATHGRGGMARWFLGSVAAAVVRQVSVPVLLVRATLPSPDRAPAG
jgi:nucleotide-binding universal stress UspA family protein